MCIVERSTSSNRKIEKLYNTAYKIAESGKTNILREVSEIHDKKKT